MGEKGHGAWCGAGDTGQGLLYPQKTRKPHATFLGISAAALRHPERYGLHLPTLTPPRRGAAPRPLGPTSGDLYREPALRALTL